MFMGRRIVFPSRKIPESDLSCFVFQGDVGNKIVKTRSAEGLLRRVGIYADRLLTSSNFPRTKKPFREKVKTVAGEDLLRPRPEFRDA